MDILPSGIALPASKTNQIVQTRMRVVDDIQILPWNMIDWPGCNGSPRIRVKTMQIRRQG